MKDRQAASETRTTPHAGEPHTAAPHLPLGAFAVRVLVALALAGGVFLAWQLASVALLAFGAVIVAILLRSLATPIQARTRLGDGLSLLCAGLLILAAAGLAGWLAGHLVADQLANLAVQIPMSAGDLRAQVQGVPLAGQILGELSSPASLASNLDGVAGRLGDYALTAVGALTNFVLVLIAGVFLAAKPVQAVNGLLGLMPSRVRTPLHEALMASGRALQRWLVGTLADMAVVGVLTTIGALLVGLPSPAALGLLAGLATFVPIVGTIAAAIPGLLLAVQFGWETVAWTLLMYVVVQQVEGSIIYPFIQRRAVDLPPYLTLFGVVIFGLLFGGLGIVLATPLLVVIVVFTKLLYQRRVLGESARLPGDAAASEPSR
ncbi:MULTISPECIES: AI-2E family transporter [unclassified Phenylobacterium]|uniref:AI-2E family transporter n=1 Tax=unclassified Phenylobacterium TaxID=2640670 RepID=UPI00083A48F6|nr:MULTISPECIES: AI-2E family transporter [unclassified Phenylobacterium]